MIIQIADDTKVERIHLLENRICIQKDVDRLERWARANKAKFYKETFKSVAYELPN